MNKIIFNILLFTALALSLKAQEEVNLRLFAKQGEQSVKLKVFPQDFDIWISGIENGYNYYRREVAQTDFVKLNNTPIMPLSGADFEGMENADSLRAFNERTVFESAREYRMPRSPYEMFKYQTKQKEEFGFYILLNVRIPTVSKISGFEFEDNSQLDSIEYVYKVEVADKTELSAQTLFSKRTKQNDLPPLSAISGEHSIRLNWPHFSEKQYVAYYVDKMFDDNQLYRLNKAPLFASENRKSTPNTSVPFIEFTDSVASNYQDYGYSLTAIDVWGEETMSEWINYFYAIDQTPLTQPEKLEVEVLKNEKALKLKWDIAKIEDDFASYRILLANKMDEFYRQIAEPVSDKSNNSFILTDAEPYIKYYFKLELTDTAGNRSLSEAKFASLPDIYPPHAPTGLKAQVNKETNKIKLDWNANKEPDVKQYMLFRAASKKGNFITISPQRADTTMWIDSHYTKGLNRDVFYYVVAIDKSFNRSDHSDTIRVVVPDNIAPVAPLLKTIQLENNEIALRWIPSPSNDIKTLLVLGSIGNTQTLDTLARLHPSINQYKNTITEGGEYRFFVLAIDSAGNKANLSNIKTLVVNMLDKGNSISKFKAKKTKGNVQLQWDFTGQEAVSYYVYRKDEIGTTKLLTATTNKSHTDIISEKNKTYTYYIKAKNSNSRTCAKSEQKVVSF